jgi:hypothetical protein
MCDKRAHWSFEDYRPNFLEYYTGVSGLRKWDLRNEGHTHICIDNMSISREPCLSPCHDQHVSRL